MTENPPPRRVESRPYQLAGIASVRESLRNLAAKKKPRRVVLCLSTGGGKTHCGALIIQAGITKGSRALFVAHRKEIINQTSAKLDEMNVDHGVIMAGHKRWRPHAPVQVASRDTLLARVKNDSFRDSIGSFDIVVFDECHHLPSASGIGILSLWPDAVVLGLTATPVRLDGKGLGGELFQDMVVVSSVKELTDMGYLVPVTGFVYAQPDFSKIKKRGGGDYTAEQQDMMMREIVLGGAVIKDYLDHAKGQRALAFAVNVEHSRAVVEQARAAGIPAEHVDADTPAEIREAILGRGGRLETGTTLFVSNCQIATEGTDIPAIEVIVLMRPTTSESLARQMYGRGLRTWCFTCRSATKPGCIKSHKVKTVCRIHDHAGVMERHGLPDEDPGWELNPDKPREHKPAPTRKCKKCKAIVAASCFECPLCGYVFEKMEGMTVVTEDATRVRLSIEELRARRSDGAKDMSDEDVRRAHNATRDQKIGEYLLLHKTQREKNFAPKFPDARFRSIFGHWPRFTDEELAEGEPATKSFIPWKRKPQ